MQDTYGIYETNTTFWLENLAQRGRLHGKDERKNIKTGLRAIRHSE
jgi:hypothetical protein